MTERYLPLYRKYRPQSFADVVGQVPVVQTLRHAIAAQKVAHAYLFCGPRGTGKTSMARILAKSLNCAEGPTDSPCQICASCTGIVQGQAMDVIELDAASNNKVEDIRDLIENVQFASMNGKYRIFIIDEIHMLSTAAFNALLKTLEEPPPNVVFIFATTEAHKVLPTIVSRCQSFDFSRITTAQLAQRIEFVAQQEGLVLAPEVAPSVARHAKGGMRNALSMLDQVSVLAQANPDQPVTLAQLEQFLGALPEAMIWALIDAMATSPNQEPTAVHNAIQALLGHGAEPMQVLTELVRALHQLFLTSAMLESKLAVDTITHTLDLSDHQFQLVQARCAVFKKERFPVLIQGLLQLEIRLRQSTEPALWLEIGLLDLAYPADTQKAPKSVATPVSTPAPTLTPTPQPQPALKPEPAPQTQQVQQQQTGTWDTPAWPSVLQAISSMPTRALLSEHTQFQSCANGVLTLVSAAAPKLLDRIRSTERLQAVEAAWKTLTGHSVKVVIKAKAADEKPPASLMVEPANNSNTDDDSERLAQAKQYSQNLLKGTFL